MTKKYARKKCINVYSVVFQLPRALRLHTHQISIQMKRKCKWNESIIIQWNKYHRNMYTCILIYLVFVCALKWPAESSLSYAFSVRPCVCVIVCHTLTHAVIVIVKNKIKILNLWIAWSGEWGWMSAQVFLFLSRAHSHTHTHDAQYCYKNDSKQNKKWYVHSTQDIGGHTNKCKSEMERDIVWILIANHWTRDRHW